jgi:hypothetical protein
MKKLGLFAISLVLLGVPLTGCGEKTGSTPPLPSPVSSTTATATPTVTPSPLTKPTETATPATTGLENTDAAGLESTIKDYNAEVDASNDKAKDIIDGYNERIKSATGK